MAGRDSPPLDVPSGSFKFADGIFRDRKDLLCISFFSSRRNAQPVRDFARVPAPSWRQIRRLTPTQINAVMLPQSSACILGPFI
jgi:hypothetical protein